MREKSVTLSADDAGQRVDAWLKEAYPYAPRRHWRTAAEQGALTLDGRVAKPGWTLRAGQVLAFPEPPSELVANRELAGKLTVVHQDDDILVVVKPARLASTPIDLSESQSVANAVIALAKSAQTASPDPRDAGLVQRLDIGTHGLLVAAKHPTAYERLTESLRAGFWDKRYLAYTTSHGRLPERLRDTLTAEGDKGRKMRVVPHRQNERQVHRASKTWEADSDITWRGQGRYMQVLEVRARKAVRHQVRVQLASRGAPLLGDTLYDGPPLPEYPGFALVAHRVTLPHPATGLATTFTIEPPPRLMKALEAIEDRPLPHPT